MKLFETSRKVEVAAAPGAGGKVSIVTEERFRGITFGGRKGERHLAMESPRAGRNPIATSPAGWTHFPHRTEGVPFLPEQISFVDEILRRAGLNPRDYRIAPLARRIPACLRALKVETMAAALNETASSPARLLQAVNALLIGTTSFFRDRAVFEEVERRVIPALLRRGKSPRVWSAASSDGTELYSVVMLFDRLGTESAIFFGTDCRASAVARARQGIYHVSTTTEIPAELARDYLHVSDNVVRVDDGIRRRVRWEEADLMSRPVGLRWDLILCRNLAIYLEPEPMMRLWKKLSAAIVPGGFLVVGRAEKPPLDGFSCVAPCIYQKNLLPSKS